MKPIKIEFADGTKREIDQTVSIQELKMDKYHTSGISAQVINLQRYDVILGKPWLYHANPIVNWQHNTITFKYGTKTIQVKASDVRSTTRGCNSIFISRKQLASTPATAELFTVNLSMADKIEETPVPAEAQKLIAEFKNVFPEGLPNKLPPKRTIDYSINVISGLESPS